MPVRRTPTAAPRAPTRTAPAGDGGAAGFAITRPAGPAADAATRYAALTRALRRRRAVAAGTPRFGHATLSVEGRIFAMLSPAGELVLKLPAERVDALIAAGDAERFMSGRRAPLREWVVTTPAARERWLELAREALAFVGAAGR